jgi:nitrate/nitrite transport system ATP-binding protein
MSVYLRLDRLSKEFGSGRGTSLAIRDVSLEVAQGEFVTLIGHSGCGKSTVLNMVAGLTAPTTGQVLLDGKRVDAPGADRAMVFQNYSLLPWLSVFGNVYQAVDAVFGPLSPGYRKQEVTERYLRMVSLWDHRDKRPSQLSGGMRQRVSIARAFAVQPRVLLLDEPFGALDALTKPALHDALIQLWSGDGQSETVVMVTHDIDEAIYLSDRVVVMANGPAATIAEVIAVPLERPRDKRVLMHDPTFLRIKERLLELLEEGFTKPTYLKEISAA